MRNGAFFVKVKAIVPILIRTHGTARGTVRINWAHWPPVEWRQGLTDLCSVCDYSSGMVMPFFPESKVYHEGSDVHLQVFLSDITLVHYPYDTVQSPHCARCILPHQVPPGCQTGLVIQSWSKVTQALDPINSSEAKENVSRTSFPMCPLQMLLATSCNISIQILVNCCYPCHVSA